MKVTYTPNPLSTIIELDSQEVEILRLKIKIEEYEELMFSAHYHLQESNGSNVNQARSQLDPDYWCSDDKSPSDLRVDELLEYYLEELKSEHCGDCTCVAASCSKCHAESLIGFRTTSGLGKHEGHKISSAFNYKEGEVWKIRTIDEALEYLYNYDPKPTSPGWEKAGGYEQYVSRWKAEAKNAYDWLLNYKQTFLTN